MMTEVSLYIYMLLKFKFLATRTKKLVLVKHVYTNKLHIG